MTTSATLGHARHLGRQARDHLRALVHRWAHDDGEVVARPVLPVADLAVAEDFHRALGFEVTRWDDDYAWVTLADREILHLARVPDLDVATNRAQAYLFVPDVAAWHDRARSASLEPSAPADQPWGLREFTVVDPSGNRLRLGEPI